jgi:polyisoprenoid-binding protein YceI
MRSMRWAAVGLAVLAAGAARGADVYEVDKAHTALSFAVKHMMVSTVKGSFKDFSGTIEFDPAKPLELKASAKIAVASIDTANADRDKHLRSPDFFNAEAHPEITFAVAGLEKSGDQTFMAGELTMKGVTKKVSVPVTVNGPVNDPYGNTRIGIEGSFTVNRKDYGINFHKVLDNGGLVVGDDVKIEISVEGVKKK